LRTLKISFHAYSPLAGGFLVKTPDFINRGGAGRWDASTPVGGMYHKMYKRTSLLKALNTWEEISKETGVSKAALAYRWCVYHSALSAEFGDRVIIGASKVVQLEESQKALKDGKLGSDILKRINDVWETVKDESPVDNYHL
jgi:aflatoxin B1 aldehyde reductase